mgnify:CR=1 FL=1
MDSLVNYIQDINASTAGATSVVDSIQSWIWENFLFVALIVVGLFLTIRTRAVQWRSLPEMLRVLTDPSGHEADGSKSISSFRAFTVSAASRVGTGNIAGVAVAIAMGGPGAVFWMWVIAAVGGASAFAESLLGQLYKERGKDSYIGGPAYYMQRGLNARWLGLIFVGFIVLTYSFVFCAVQTNAIVEAGANSFNISIEGTDGMGFRIVVGLFIAALTAAIIFGGIRRVSKAAEIIVPLMAVLYLVIALFIIATNISLIPEVFGQIFSNAFKFDSAAGGFLGGLISTTMMQGIKRGLYSNEAGMGSAPNAAAAAEVKHPVSQGMIQMLGVFVDTIIVCSCTAFIVLTYQQPYGDLSGAALTQAAIVNQVGEWGAGFLAVILFMFAFSTVIGNYAYAESNVQFIKSHWLVTAVFRMLVLAWVYFGAVANVPLVWDMADMAMGIMAWINLVAILLLSPLAFLLLKDYTAKLKMGKDPEFKLSEHPGLKRKIKSDIW